MPRVYIADPTELHEDAKVGYVFDDWLGRRQVWPKTRGETLAATGAFNFFVRAGYRVQVIKREEISSLGANDILVVDIPESWKPADRRLIPYMDGHHQVLFSGNFLPLQENFGANAAKFVAPSSAYNCFGIRIAGRMSPLQPPAWGAYVVDFSDHIHVRAEGRIYQIFGDRLSPSTANWGEIEDCFLLLEMKLAERHVVFLNALVFAALQSWLQGQEDLIPWLQWNSRQHWLDDYVDLLFEALKQFMSFDIDRLESLEGPPKTSICLRHDNDDSVDSTFPGLEAQAGVPGTYALLDDRNLREWKKIAATYPTHEYALHYTTIEPKREYGKYLSYAILRSPWKYLLGQMRFGADVLTGGNLVRQVQQARSRGIGVATLHRHWTAPQN